MGFLSKSKTDTRYGVIIDVGSGSVLVAIVASDQQKNHPDIIWSKREYTLLRKAESLEDSAKSIMTSLINAFMLLDSEGRKVFFEKTGLRKIPTVQVTIAAPWSYTVTKTINYQNEEPFEVTDTLIEELLRTAQQKVTEELRENERVHELGLSIIARTVIDILGNGYSIIVTGKQKAVSLKVIEATAVAQKYLVDAIADAKGKIVPSADLFQFSFMLAFFYTMQDLLSDVKEYCLVDVTYEATEIGVVRDGILNYCTHIPYGSLSFARDLSEILSVTIEEAMSYLESPDTSEILAKYSDRQREAYTEVVRKYQDKLVELFSETGDSLTIPKTIFLHSNLYTEPFFKKQVADAAKANTKSSHGIKNVSAEILKKKYPAEISNEVGKVIGKDTALMVSAQFFHNHRYYAKFEQL
jgi:hypothetical protein